MHVSPWRRWNLSLHFDGPQPSVQMIPHATHEIPAHGVHPKQRKVDPFSCPHAQPHSCYRTRAHAPSGVPVPHGPWWCHPGHSKGHATGQTLVPHPGMWPPIAPYHGNVFAQRGHSANYYVVYPGNTPEHHPPTEACTINSKQHRGAELRTLGPMASITLKKNPWCTSRG